MATIEKLFEFMKICGQLKKEKRTGWVNHKVKSPESVAEHMYRMAILTFLLNDTQLTVDKTRCMKIALVHDFAESLVGDITPWDGISKEEKHKMEKEAMERITDLLSIEVGKELLELWKEYEAQQTAEAKAVKDLDRFEMIMQAYEYEEDENRFGDLQDFFNSTDGKFQHPSVKKWDTFLRNKRKEKLE